MNVTQLWPTPTINWPPKYKMAVTKKISFWSKMVKKTQLLVKVKVKNKQLPPLRPLRDASSGLGTRATTEPAGTSLLLTR